MKPITQICADMVDSQLLLDRLCVGQRASLQHGDTLRARGCGWLIQEVRARLAVQQLNLRRHPAANDATISSGAA